MNSTWSCTAPVCGLTILTFPGTVVLSASQWSSKEHSSARPGRAGPWGIPGWDHPGDGEESSGTHHATCTHGHIKEWVLGIPFANIGISTWVLQPATLDVAFRGFYNINVNLWLRWSFKHFYELKSIWRKKFLVLQNEETVLTGMHNKIMFCYTVSIYHESKKKKLWGKNWWLVLNKQTHAKFGSTVRNFEITHSIISRTLLKLL